MAPLHGIVLSDEEIDRRAEYKLDLASYGYFAAYVKRRFWFFSWWEEAYRDSSLERCTEYLQTLIQLPRRFTRKVVPKP